MGTTVSEDDIMEMKIKGTGKMCYYVLQGFIIINEKIIVLMYKTVITTVVFILE